MCFPPMLGTGEEGVDEGVAVVDVSGDVVVQNVVGLQAVEGGVEGGREVGRGLGAHDKGEAARTHGTEHAEDDGVEAQAVGVVVRGRGEVCLEGRIGPAVFRGDVDGVVAVAAENGVGGEAAGGEGKGVVLGVGVAGRVFRDNAVEAGAAQQLGADDVADVLGVRVGDGGVLGCGAGQLELGGAGRVELRHQQLDGDVCCGAAAGAAAGELVGAVRVQVPRLVRGGPAAGGRARGAAEHVGVAGGAVEVGVQARQLGVPAAVHCLLAVREHEGAVRVEDAVDVAELKGRVEAVAVHKLPQLLEAEQRRRGAARLEDELVAVDKQRRLREQVRVQLLRRHLGQDLAVDDAEQQLDLVQRDGTQPVCGPARRQLAVCGREPQLQQLLGALERVRGVQLHRELVVDVVQVPVRALVLGHLLVGLEDDGGGHGSGGGGARRILARFERFAVVVTVTLKDWKITRHKQAVGSMDAASASVRQRVGVGQLACV